ncbi:hypothetical protein AAFF_G00217380 [Aldrovandia affinis]|uniref:Secreted protein n=1 Tax=Aldrovandia affinis TaxID=143900 RepID=A0AAD7WVC1_9TELE|nr:hypothetical protein AAFF_G00217380 [Aldrovandia affinis]
MFSAGLMSISTHVTFLWTHLCALSFALGNEFEQAVMFCARECAHGCVLHIFHSFNWSKKKKKKKVTLVFKIGDSTVQNKAHFAVRLNLALLSPNFNRRLSPSPESPAHLLYVRR